MSKRLIYWVGLIGAGVAIAAWFWVAGVAPRKPSTDKPVVSRSTPAVPAPLPAKANFEIPVISPAASTVSEDVTDGLATAASLAGGSQSPSNGIARDDLDKRAAALGVGLDKDEIQKKIDAMQALLKETRATVKQEYQKLCGIHAAAVKGDPELIRLQEKRAKLEKELSEGLAAVPAVVELKARQEAAERERKEAGDKRDAAFKRKTELQRLKTETGNTSGDAEIEECQKVEQEMNTQLDVLFDELKTVPTEQMAKRNEAAQTDPKYVELRDAIDKVSASIRARMAALPDLAAQTQVCGQLSDKTTGMRTQIWRLQCLLRDFEAKSKVAQQSADESNLKHN